MAGNAGFSILEAMIGAGVIALVVGAMMTFTGLSEQKRKAIAGSQAADEIEQGLQSVIIAQLQTTGCFDPATSLAAAPLGDIGTMRYTEGITFNFRGNVSAVARAPFDAANVRCRSPVNLTGLSEHYYFCVRLTGTGTASKVSLLSSPNAFAEVYIDLRDWRDDQKLSCSAFDNQASTSGARVYYTIYWTTEGGQGSILKQKTSAAYIGH